MFPIVFTRRQSRINMMRFRNTDFFMKFYPDPVLNIRPCNTAFLCLLRGKTFCKSWSRKPFLVFPTSMYCWKACFLQCFVSAETWLDCLMFKPLSSTLLIVHFAVQHKHNTSMLSCLLFTRKLFGILLFGYVRTELVCTLHSQILFLKSNR
jgi:hypothetical protein